MQGMLRERVGAMLERGAGEPGAGAQVLPIVTVESGHRYALDAELRWHVLAPDGGRAVLAAGDAVEALHEAVEWKRDAFEEGARQNDLPPDEVVFAFPSVPLARAMLSKRAAYLVRLALQWIRPTELRELRADIVRVASSAELPRPVKDLAERLVVPE